MRIKTLNISYIIILLSLMSCQREELVSNSGNLSFILTDGQATLKRSLPDLSAESAGLFTLTLQSKDKNEIVFENTLAAFNVSAPHVYEAGGYSIVASYGSNPDIALDAPYYTSEITSFMLEANKTKELMIPCFVGNSLASFKLGNQDELNKVLKDYYIEAVVGDQSVVWHPGDTENPYFKAGIAVDFYLKGIWISNDKEYSRNFATITSSQKGKNYVYTLKINAPSMSGVALDLQVETSVETVTVNETLPQEWLPRPRITGFEGGTASLIYAETANDISAAINYKAAVPVQDLVFTLDFQDEQFVALNKTYTFSTLSDGDKTALSDAGIMLPVIDGISREGALDLTSLTMNLKTNAGAEVVNKVSLRVKANNRWSSEEGEIYEICTVKPDFSVNVKPENIWTKEFTVDEITVMVGDADKIKQDLVYQYSSDEGMTWQECNDNRRQVFIECPTVKKYKVRAVYRNVIETAMSEVQLELPIQLPNSDMEEWTDDIYKSTYYCFYPWKTKGACHWDTNNLFTTRHRYNSGTLANYNGFHAVSYVPGHGETGLAAELRSTANGRANTQAFGHTEQNYNRVAGELYTGTSEVSVNTSGGIFADADGSKDTYTRNKDAVFNVRPTALHFWYKYVPYKTDTWKAHVELLDIDKNIIIQQEYTSSTNESNWTDVTIHLNYEAGKEYAKCRYIYVIFSSTITSGGSMPYNNDKNNALTFYIDNGSETKSFKPAYIGSILTIDDISLAYDK